MARAANTLKSKSKKTTTRKKKRAKSKPFFTDERKRKWISALGLLAILFGLYLVLAFVSYIFTWQADQDKVMHFSWEYIKDKTVSADNILGKFGAIWSHQFFYFGLGLASFLVPALLILGGINLFFRKHIFPIKRTLL